MMDHSSEPVLDRRPRQRQAKVGLKPACGASLLCCRVLDVLGLIDNHIGPANLHQVLQVTAHKPIRADHEIRGQGLLDKRLPPARPVP